MSRGREPAPRRHQHLEIEPEIPTEGLGLGHLDGVPDPSLISSPGDRCEGGSVEDEGSRPDVQSEDLAMRDRPEEPSLVDPADPAHPPREEGLSGSNAGGRRSRLPRRDEHRVEPFEDARSQAMPGDRNPGTRRDPSGVRVPTRSTRPRALRPRPEAGDARRHGRACGHPGGPLETRVPSIRGRGHRRRRAAAAAAAPSASAPSEAAVRRRPRLGSGCGLAPAGAASG